MNKDRVITIRNTHESDADAVPAIACTQWSLIYAEYRKSLGDILYESTHKDDLEKKDTAVRNAVFAGRCLVAECDGVVCGFCSYLINDNVGTVTNNAVSADYKGNGIAGMLYERVFEILKENGCIAVKVTTGLGDIYAPARRAYEKAGFSKGLEQITYFKML